MNRLFLLLLKLNDLIKKIIVIVDRKNTNEYTLASWAYLIKKTLNETKNKTKIYEFFFFKVQDIYAIESMLKTENNAENYLPRYVW